MSAPVHLVSRAIDQLVDFGPCWQISLFVMANAERGKTENLRFWSFGTVFDLFFTVFNPKSELRECCLQNPTAWISRLVDVGGSCKWKTMHWCAPTCRERASPVVSDVQHNASLARLLCGICTGSPPNSLESTQQCIRLRPLRRCQQHINSKLKTAARHRLC